MIRQHADEILGLVGHLFDRLESVPRAAPIALPGRNRSSIVAMKVPAAWGLSNEMLRRNGIAATHNVGKGELRVGFHFYNARPDVDRLVEFLAEAGGARGR